MRRFKAFAIGGALLMLFGSATGVLASSHREAPLSSTDPVSDLTDIYAWRTGHDSVAFVVNTWPFEEPGGGPNFFAFGSDVRYDLNIDNNGDGRPDITYRWEFKTKVRNGSTFLYNTGVVTSLKDKDLNILQTYTLWAIDWNKGSSKVLGKNLPVPPVFVGSRSMMSATAYEKLAESAVRTVDGGIKSFAGQRDDPFFVDLGAIFDLVGLRQGPPNGGLSVKGIDSLKGFNVQSLVLDVPITKLVRNGEKTIGIWATTSRRAIRVFESDGDVDTSGPWIQVSRLGNPLVNEAVIGLQDKDRFNASKPKDDAQFLKYVTHSDLASKLNALYGIGSPTDKRNDLVAIFLTGVPGLNQPAHVAPSEMLRLNTGISPCSASCSTLGVLGGDLAGFPNGRRLTDDVVTIAERAVAGVLYNAFAAPADQVPVNPLWAQLTDGVPADGDSSPMDHFPYVAPPANGAFFEHAEMGGCYINLPHGLGGAC